MVQEDKKSLIDFKTKKTKQHTYLNKEMRKRRTEHSSNWAGIVRMLSTFKQMFKNRGVEDLIKLAGQSLCAVPCLDQE